MEKREKRERSKRIQVLKQQNAKGGHSGGSNNFTSKDIRNPQDEGKKEIEPPKVEEKKVIDHTAIPDPHMFDNLKRETDDIAALTAKKHSKRQVFSNWAKYETLPDDDDNGRIGSDYETLLRSAQIGSHFQLRSERGWDPKSLPAQSAAFTIDLGVLAASLACLPLYEKLDLPVELFSANELEQMEHKARIAQHSKRPGKSLEEEGVALYGSLLEKLMERPPPGDQNVAPPTQTTEEYDYVNDESDGFNFGTVCTPTKDTAIPVSQMKEKLDPPKSDVQQRLTPPKEDTVDTSSSKYESVPMEGETQEVPYIESTPLPPRGSRRSLHAKNMTAEPSSSQAVTKGISKVQENDHPEDLVQESGGKKKSRGGKNKSNKNRSLDVGHESTFQSPVSDSCISSMPSENVSVHDAERNDFLPSTPKVTTHEVRKDHKVKGASSKEKTSNNEEKIVAMTSEVNVSVNRITKSKEIPELSQENVISPMQPDSPVEKYQERKLDEEISVFPSKKDDELDELLSLRQPVASQHVLNFAVPTSAVKASIDEEETSPSSKPVAAEKKEDLEDWLDSMLDD